MDPCIEVVEFTKGTELWPEQKHWRKIKMDIRKPAAFGVRLLASILDGFILTFTSGFIIYIFSGEFSIDWTNGVV